MSKKIIALVGAGALLLGMVSPVLGWWSRPWDVDVAVVTNSASAQSYTGGNSQHNDAYAGMGMDNDAYAGSGSGNRSLTTGNAGSSATAVVVANTDASCGCYMEPCWCRENDVDFARVGNSAGAVADSGLNGQDDEAHAGWGCDNDAYAGNGSGNRTMRTGNAWSNADAWSIVNMEMH